MSDLDLKQRVEEELGWQPSIDAAGVGVAVAQGVVSLTGYVGSYRELYALERAVKRVKGVRGYAQDVEVRLAPDATSDVGIASKAASILDWDSAVPKDAVQVKVQHGFITLTGTVDRADQKAAAERGLRRLGGVRGIANLITLRPTPQEVDLKDRIEAALGRRADVGTSEVTVSIRGDRVILDGHAPNWAEHEAVMRATWAAPGVVAVEDRMVVGG